MTSLKTSSKNVDFTGYDEIDVLQALIDNIKPPSPFYHRLGKLDHTAALAMIERDSIPYANGRMLGVTFKEFPIIDATNYDKHNGEGSMERALELLFSNVQ